MAFATPSQQPLQPPLVQPPPGIADPHEQGFPPGWQGRLLFWIAVLFSLFQVATAAHVIDFPSQVVRAVPRGAGAPALTAAHVPAWVASPAATEAIVFGASTLTVPD